MIRRLIASMLLLIVLGCASGPPIHPWTGHDDALARIRQRTASVNSMQGQCRVRLTRARGNNVRLDGAVVWRRPDQVRVRLWKFSHAVIDFARDGQDAWLWHETGLPESVRSWWRQPDSGVAAAARSLFAGSDDGREGAIEDDGGSTFGWRRALDGGRSVLVLIDRPTHTVKQIRVEDAGTTVGLVVTLDRYRRIDGHVWPLRWRFEAGEGAIEIDFDPGALHLNVDLPASALRPSRRAVKVR